MYRSHTVAGRDRKFGVLWLILLGSAGALAFAAGDAAADGPEVYASGPLQESGQLLVTTFPEGAEIRLDSEILGITPMDAQTVEPGWHLIQAWKSGLFASTRVRIPAGEITTVALTLNGGRGSLSVLSTPDDAVVVVDGREMGRTPVTLEGIRAGYHVLRVGKEGRLEYRTTVEITNGEESLLKVQLPVPAILELNSDPEGAAVHIRNHGMGNTPLTLTSLPTGPTEISMRLENYEEWRETRDLAEGATLSVAAELIPKRFSVDFHSEPAGARIFVDGELLGTTPLRWTLPHGERMVAFSADGYEEYALTTMITERAAPSLSVRLTPLKGYLTLRDAPSGALITLANSESMTRAAPLEALAVPIGRRRLKLQAPGYESIHMEVLVQYDKETVLQPAWIPRTDAGGLWRTLVPGWSQRYQRKRVRSVLIPLAQAAAAVGLLVTTNTYNDAVEDFETAFDRYNNLVAPADIEAAWSETESRYDRAEDKRSVRNMFLGATLAVYAYHLIDAIFLVPDSSGDGSLLGVTAIPETESAVVGLRVRF